MKLNFEFTPEITKEFLLSHYSEETYMEYYLGLPVKKGLFRNPLRNDNNPTASFFRNSNKELIFKDFGWDFYGNFVNVVMYKFHCSYYEALKIIAQDFNLIKGSNTKDARKIIQSKNVFQDTNPSQIQIEMKDFSKDELNWWEEYGITSKILHKFNVYSCRSVFLNSKLFAQSAQHCPIYGYYFGEQDKQELWRIYFPKRKSYRFISNTSSKKIQGFKQLPKMGNLLVITKSMKDVMTLYSLGIPAIAPNSENLFVDNKMLNGLKERFKHIVVLYDNDLAGLSNMKKIKKEHPDLIYTWIPLKYEAKDISDFHKKYGRHKTLETLKEYLLWLSKT